MKLLCLAGVGVAALLALPASAHMGPGGPDAGPVTRTELKAKLDAKFAEADTDKDGVITRAEWDAARAAKRAERKDKAFDRIDANKDGSISRSEWDGPRPDRGPPPGADAGGGHHHHGMEMAMGGEMFDRLDADHDGKVTLAEFEAKPLEMFDRADTNHDGTVTPEERKAAWEAMREKWKGKRGE
ncbi:EF-hand domain-containing protein [Flavisphingomonas formosensis]|uniref:EF-hand domain-containing protein n=1 Tax=Flavisphingomonas formosensis TaxID=861534 RepID=UPI0012F72F9A|nr:EF-hand domain-containing protein [Sphingomonas formosensis]